MLRCDYVWSSPRSHVTFYDHDYGEILSQAPSQLLKILHACTITRGNRGFSVGTSRLFSIHCLLDFPWDEIRKSICPLRTIMDKNKGNLDGLLTYASDASLRPKPASIFYDLSRGYLRLMRSVLDHKLPSCLIWTRTSTWGFILRASSPCDVILREVRELEFASAGTALLDYTLPHDFHNILQWLKTFPEPPHDLIARFEHHLERSIVEHGIETTFNGREEEWICWKKDILG
ncbi:hypothetical protein C8R44DRAFT_190324 [Mycena epipterygia]|nr:hypothetical protein C8R44DRAFT_190324 [Mycena epipterygia]